MAAPYQTPTPLDLDAINNQTVQFFGYPVFGYWYFFNETSAADVIAQKVRRSTVSMTDILFAG
jgi:soluble epoxide hydrolase/lipid-phosphate phosphatase